MSATNSKLKIAVFACQRSGLIAVRELEGNGLPADVHAMLVEVPCGGTIDEPMVLKALEQGADGVLALVCYERSCQSLEGNSRVPARLANVRRVLAEIGLSHRPVECREVSAASAVRCGQALEEIAAVVRGGKQSEQQP